MIYGIGTDLVDIGRIEKAMKKNALFLNNCFSENERIFINDRKKRKYRAAAMNFAGKEAVAKALRTGFCREVRIKQIEILREASGAPFVTLSGETKEYAKKCGIQRIHISLSDTEQFAMAYATAEGVERM